MLSILNQAVVAATCLSALIPAAAAATKPNFIFIITDDQDLLLDSLTYQSSVQELLVNEGTYFSKHFCTISLCCPSRVSLLTGRAAHNTNVTDVSAPYGGYDKFAELGWNDNYLPIWLQDAGYNTYYTGKLMNSFSTSNWNSPHPNGWTKNDFFLDPYTYIYYNVTSQRDNEEPVSNYGNYSTDIVTNNTLRYLDEAMGADEPFFIGVAPIGPHAQTESSVFYPPVPAKRHEDLFPGLQVPRTDSFNPDVASGGGWIKTVDQLNSTQVEYGDEFYRKRILALQAVDEMVASVVDRLSEQPEVLDNTYIIYTSDNGYHVGQHRLSPGKTCGIEEDINVPFVVRGPGVAKGATYTQPSSHTDIVPTLFELAGIQLQDAFDGVPIPVTTEMQESTTRKTEHVQVEFWGDGILEGTMKNTGSMIIDGSGINNTYKTLRVLSENYDLSYTVWCTGDHELYDMVNDPYQMNNIFPSSDTAAASTVDIQVAGWPVTNLMNRLDAVLLTLKSCSGAVCRDPWAALHPEGGVTSLTDAMESKFNSFYDSGYQQKVTFSMCAQGYITDYELPLHSVPFTDFTASQNEGNGNKVRWEDWV